MGNWAMSGTGGLWWFTALQACPARVSAEQAGAGGEHEVLILRLSQAAEGRPRQMPAGGQVQPWVGQPAPA